MELVEDGGPVGDRRKQPVEVVFVDTLGKKATIARSSRALGPSFSNVGEASESSMVAARLSLCFVRSTPVRRFSHSLVNRSLFQLF